MALKIAVQMDPIASINPAADSTFALMLEAQARGHALDYYTPTRWRCATTVVRRVSPDRGLRQAQGPALPRSATPPAATWAPTTWC